MDNIGKERADGLVNLKQIRLLKKLKHKIRKDLIKDGFDDDDAADYVDGVW